VQKKAYAIGYEVREHIAGQVVLPDIKKGENDAGAKNRDELDGPQPLR